MKLDHLKIKELLLLDIEILKELKNRGILRTRNNPVGDYTEWLVSEKMNMHLENNSKAGYDAIDKNGKKVQIKGRRLTPENPSRQLSTIRNYEKNDFDYLVVVIFNEDYEILDAVSIPHEIIIDYAKYRDHVNGYVLILKGDILTDGRIKHIKGILDS